MTDTTQTGPGIREVPLAPGGALEISLASSDVRLRGIDGDRVVVRTRDGEPVDDHVSITTDGPAVRVGSAGLAMVRIGPLRLQVHRTPDLDIDLPRAAQLSVRTLSGDVEAAGIAGPSRWATASGRLRVQVDGGPVAVETMSGDVTLESSAPIEVAAQTVSGDSRITAPELLGLEVSSTSGTLRIVGRLATGRVHALSSVSGDVEIHTDSPVRLDGSTVAGDIRATVAHRAEGGRGRRTLIVGDGSVPVSVRTMSGDVRLYGGAEGLRERGGRRAAPPAQAPAPPDAASVRPAAPVEPEPADPSVLVAEASAAPNLVRREAPAAGEPAPEPRPQLGERGPIDRREAARLDILRALERGDVDVETASRRLEALEDAGPRAFRGWC